MMIANQIQQQQMKSTPTPTPTPLYQYVSSAASRCSAMLAFCFARGHLRSSAVVEDCQSRLNEMMIMLSCPSNPSLELEAMACKLQAVEQDIFKEIDVQRMSAIEDLFARCKLLRAGLAAGADGRRMRMLSHCDDVIRNVGVAWTASRPTGMIPPSDAVAVLGDLQMICRYLQEEADDDTSIDSLLREINCRCTGR